MVRLTRAIEFSTSLRYWRRELSERENQDLFGALARQHGHNYRLEVTVQGEPDPVTGMVINLVDLKQILEKEVMERFDHRDLNADTSFFDDRPPTPEHFAAVIWEVLARALPDGLLYGIRLHQDRDLYVDVVGGAG